MTLAEIMEAWKADSTIDRTELGLESIKIPQLHSKYYNMFAQERTILRKLDGDYKKLYKIKHEYYNGILSEEELEENGWEPFSLKILKTDMSIYLEADEDIIAMQNKIHVQKEKVDFLESAIKSLTNRGYQIKSAIDWEKFKVGA